MSIGVHDQLGTCAPGHLGYVTIGQAVAASGGKLQSYVVHSSKQCILLLNEAWMGQDVHIGALHGRTVGTRRYGLDRGLAMHYHQPGAEMLCPPGEWGNQAWGDVRDLYAWDKGQIHALNALPPEQKELAHYLGEVGGVHMIGNGQRTVVQDLGMAQQLAGKQGTIAQE